MHHCLKISTSCALSAALPVVQYCTHLMSNCAADVEREEQWRPQFREPALPRHQRAANSLPDVRPATLLLWTGDWRPNDHWAYDWISNMFVCLLKLTHDWHNVGDNLDDFNLTIFYSGPGAKMYLELFIILPIQLNSRLLKVQELSSRLSAVFLLTF